MKVTEQNFDELMNSGMPAMIDFGATWCGPCKALAPRIEEIAAAFGALEQPVIAAIQKAEAAGEAYTLALPGGEVVLNPGDYAIASEDVEGWQVASEGSLTVALDVEVFLNLFIVVFNTPKVFVRNIKIIFCLYDKFLMEP